MARTNSAEFAWSDVTVTLMGRVFDRIMAVSYDVEIEKKQIYGRGSKVRGIQPGNERPTGSITIGQSELEAMIRKAQETYPNAKATDLVFDIQVHYLSVNGLALVKDKIVGAEFTKNPKNLRQGDSDMEIQMDFIAMDILYNVK